MTDRFCRVEAVRKGSRHPKPWRVRDHGGSAWIHDAQENRVCNVGLRRREEAEFIVDAVNAATGSKPPITAFRVEIDPETFEQVAELLWQQGRCSHVRDAASEFLDYPASVIDGVWRVRAKLREDA